MPATPDTKRPETIIAFDFGLRRIGVAVGQDLTASASPLATVRNSRAGPDWPAIGALVGEWRPARLIVGMPIREDGSRPEIASNVEWFVDALKRYSLPVELVDERYSSIEAKASLKSERASGLRGRISKEAVDSVAAALIAERWLAR